MIISKIFRDIPKIVYRQWDIPRLLLKRLECILGTVDPVSPWYRCGHFSLSSILCFCKCKKSCCKTMQRVWSVYADTFQDKHGPQPVSDHALL